MSITFPLCCNRNHKREDTAKAINLCQSPYIKSIGQKQYSRLGGNDRPLDSVLLHGSSKYTKFYSFMDIGYNSILHLSVVLRINFLCQILFLTFYSLYLDYVCDSYVLVFSQQTYLSKFWT